MQRINWKVFFQNSLMSTWPRNLDCSDYLLPISNTIIGKNKRQSPQSKFLGQMPMSEFWKDILIALWETATKMSPHLNHFVSCNRPLKRYNLGLSSIYTFLRKKRTDIDIYFAFQYISKYCYKKTKVIGNVKDLF